MSHTLFLRGYIMNTCIRATDCSCKSKPPIFMMILFVGLLLVIHTTDMILTREVVGNNWQNETFLPMSYCIKWFGIYNSLWLSRIGTYGMLFIYFLNRKSWKWFYFLVTCTLLYWAAMVHWLWTLGYVSWPH